MKRFTFRLERLLRARRLVERERKRQLADAIARAEQLRREAESAAQHRREAEDQIAELRTESQYAGIKSSLEAALRSIRRRATMQALGHADAQAAVERAREAMVEARREAEALEKLKTRQRREWEAEVSRVDQKANDELAARMAEERVTR